MHAAAWKNHAAIVTYLAEWAQRKTLLIRSVVVGLLHVHAKYYVLEWSGKLQSLLVSNLQGCCAECDASLRVLRCGSAAVRKVSGSSDHCDGLLGGLLGWTTIVADGWRLRFFYHETCLPG